MPIRPAAGTSGVTEMQDNLERQPEVSYLGAALIRNARRVLNSREARAARKTLTLALTLLMLQALAVGLAHSPVEKCIGATNS